MSKFFIVLEEYLEKIRTAGCSLGHPVGATNKLFFVEGSTSEVKRRLKRVGLALVGSFRVNGKSYRIIGEHVDIPREHYSVWNDWSYKGYCRTCKKVTYPKLFNTRSCGFCGTQMMRKRSKAIRYSEDAESAQKIIRDKIRNKLRS